MKKFSLGFTLIELLISISIIGIISALVVVKFSAFDSSVLLKSAAYEVALALRDAQVYAVSVHGESGSFDYPYGVHFTPNANSYTFFQDSNSNTQYNNGTDAVIRTFSIGRSIEVYDVCVNTGAGDVCTAGTLDITFKRPEFSALFYDGGTSGINSTKIKVKSTRGNDVWIVEVGLLGHISVYKE